MNEIKPIHRNILYSVLVTVALVALLVSLRVLANEDLQPRIIITEILAYNRDIITDEDGDFPDFIELYNAGRVRVYLGGWFLSDSDNRPLRWQIPGGIWLYPGEYIYFFASGKDRQQENGIWHTNFSIARDGTEPVILSMPNGQIHDRVPPFVSGRNMSFGLVYENGEIFWAHLSVPSPGQPNTGLFFRTLEEIDLTPERLIITEYMTRNHRFFPDENGEFHDWVEIYNPTDTRVYLQNWFLSDREDNLTRWRFPEGVYINPGEFLVLHLSGYHRPWQPGQPIHVTFRLSARDVSITLSDPNEFIVDRIPVHETPLFASFGRDAYGNEGFFAMPTPGSHNIGTPAATIEELHWHDRPTLLIMEYMSNNNFSHPDEDGDFNDWVEIFNYGTHPVSLDRISISDSHSGRGRWYFPYGYYLGPGERVVLHMSGKLREGRQGGRGTDSLLDGHWHLPFRLGITDDGLFIRDQYGRTIDEVMPIIRPRSHVSVGRNENNWDEWLFFPRPTPGQPNTTYGFRELAGQRANPFSSLYIREISAAGWVSLANVSEEPVHLLGWSLTDTRGDWSKEPLPDREIPPNSAVRINLVNIQINYRGRTLYLTDCEGLIADIFSSGNLRPGVTALRCFANGDARLLANPTGQTFIGYALPVYASIDDIFVEAGTAVYLWTNDPYGVIHFTLDSNTPTQRSRIFNPDEPIIINSTTVIRARVYSPYRLPSRVLSRTYLVGITHTLPVLTLVSDHDGLFSWERGIFMDGPNMDPYSFFLWGANWWNRWERDTHFGFYVDGDLRVETDASIRIHGAFSRFQNAQRNILVHFRQRHGGVGVISYPLIPHIDRHEFDALLLRMSGQDWGISRLRDSFIHNAVIEDTHITGQAATPVVVYINGQFWGHYNLRERLNPDFFEIHHGIPKDEIDLIRQDTRVLAGDLVAKRELRRRLNAMTNMNTPEALEFIKAHIDLDNWIDYWIIITFFANNDTGNIRYYRPRTEDGRWRWILWDQDHALWARGNPFDNMLHHYGHGFSYNCTLVARRLMANNYVRNRFLERYAYLLSYILHPDRLIPILDAYAALLEPEMPHQIARWGRPGSMANWRANLENIRRFLRNRESQMHAHIRERFNLSSARMYELFGVR